MEITAYIIIALLLLAISLLSRLSWKGIDTSGIERCLREELALSRKESGHNFKDIREEVTHQMTSISKVQNEQMDHLTESLEKKITRLQEDNHSQLDKMRKTVDEKLHHTLEKRLGQSFDQVTKRLEEVHKGLGEMRNLASGVGDLKKVLSNVKTRGIIGEYQLGNILEELLSPGQYDMNVATVPGSAEFVEFAIKMPGKEQDSQVWLPVDSKFPLEVYQQLQEAYENTDKPQIEKLSKELVNAVKLFAKDIHTKYISPPHTTEFGIMFLPFEGLFAEVIRQPGILEQIQRDYRITITGPTTLSAFLNSLQMGFRTLAIEKRSSEVWKLLEAVKNEFGKFGLILEKTQKKLKSASKEIELAGSKSRTIERKLRDVQELPANADQVLLVNGHEKE